VPLAEAREIDPQQRCLLNVNFEAYHDAGLRKRSLTNSDGAVFVGICNNDYDTLLRDRAAGAFLGGGGRAAVLKIAERIAYVTYAFAANRVSHSIGLLGPSIALDTASSSALVATHMAWCDARARDVDGGDSLAATASAEVRGYSNAAGVNVIMHPQLMELHSNRSMFPLDGRCKTFDASADGFCRGEGSVAIALRGWRLVAASRMWTATRRRL